MGCFATRFAIIQFDPILVKQKIRSCRLKSYKRLTYFLRFIFLLYGMIRENSAKGRYTIVMRKNTNTVSWKNAAGAEKSGHILAAALLALTLVGLTACGKKDGSVSSGQAGNTGTVSVQTNDAAGDTANQANAEAAAGSDSAQGSGDANIVSDPSAAEVYDEEDAVVLVDADSDDSGAEQTFDEDTDTASGWTGTYDGVSGEVLSITEDGDGILFSFRNSGISGDASVEENNAVYSGMDGYTLQFCLSGAVVEVTAIDAEGQVDSQTAVSGTYSRQ